MGYSRIFRRPLWSVVLKDNFVFRNCEVPRLQVVYMRVVINRN